MNESEWTRRVCDALTNAGAICIAHVMTKMSSHIPDRSIVSVHGNFWVEFKGAHTKLRPGQEILINRINSRYPCAFVYRFPNMLILGQHWTTIDALSDPAGFLLALKTLSCADTQK